MRYIKRAKDETLPVEFTNWLTSDKNEKKIETDIADEHVTGKQLWSFFRDDGTVAYEALKKHLVEVQGFICCYCGQRIENDMHTAVEHLQPKSIFKSKIFDYNNLLASCKGGSSNKIHTVQEGETLLSIAEDYKIDIEHLVDVYVHADELQLFGKKYDIENLSVGDRIVIIPLVDEKSQHCDIKKGKNEIAINPLQKDCTDYFTYNVFNGKIIISDLNKKTINTLGLNNNRYLNQLRKKTIDSAFQLKENFWQTLVIRNSFLGITYKNSSKI